MNAPAELELDARIPRSVEAEQSVLGALLVDNGAWEQVADLIDSRNFFDSRHRVIFDAIGGLVVACKQADVISVFERLQAARKDKEVGGLPYLHALEQSVASARNARRHAEIVRDKALHRALIAATEEAGSIAREEAPASQKADRIVTMFDQLQREQVQQRPRQASELIVARVDHYSDRAEGRVPIGAPTGLKRLDAALNGGLQPGRVYVLAARPSVGKTSLSLQIGLDRARAGDGVLVLSQEMPAEECIDRNVCNLGGVDYGRMQRGELNDVDWAGVSRASDEINRLPLWIDDQPALTLADIRGKAMSVRRHGLKLVILDYLQLCAGSGQGRLSNRNAEIEEISRGIKTLAKQLRISVILLSQLNRAVETRQTPEPNLSDLRDSGAIEQDADCVLFLWPVREFTGHQILAMTVAKNRQGKKGERIALELQGQYQRWNDSDADINPPPRKTAATSGGID